MENINNEYYLAKSIIKSILKCCNFITPNIIDYYLISKYAIELSTNKSLNGDYIYGVTVVDYEYDNTHITNCKYNYELSKCFYTLKEAKNYISSLNI